MTELFDALLQLAALILLSLGAAVVPGLARLLAERLRLANDAQVRAYLMGVLERAVEYGQAEARRRLAAEPGASRASLSDLGASLARDYAWRHAPDALERFGADDAAVDRMVRARLPRPPIAPGAIG